MKKERKKDRGNKKGIKIKRKLIKRPLFFKMCFLYFCFCFCFFNFILFKWFLFLLLIFVIVVECTVIFVFFSKSNLIFESTLPRLLAKKNNFHLLFFEFYLFWKWNHLILTDFNFIFLIVYFKIDNKKKF